ncbi:AMP-binding protein [Flavobacteriaceae bacterium W22]|nr:AMP-binding protein [Flavobacteriaceae bacterium W22]
MNAFIKNLFSSFKKNSDNICLKIENKNYTYAEVSRFAQQIRSQLQNTDSQNIGIYLTDDVYMYASILAIWFEGKTYVPLHPGFPISKNLNIISQAEIEIVLSSIEMQDHFGIKILNSKEDLGKEEKDPKNSSINNNAYILFTSGSTGNPKGVPIQFSNLFYFADSFHNTFGNLTPADNVLQMFDLTFDLSVMSYLIPWLNGSKVVALHKRETKFLQILDLLEADEITVALMVPSILNLIIPYLDTQIQNKSLRMNLFCGEALLTKQIEGWKHFIPNAQIYNVYGPTENTIFCTYYKIEQKIKAINGIVSIGKSMINSQLSFDKDEAKEGELLLSGKLLTRCYWKNDDKTKEAFFNDNRKTFYKTGDWCIKDDDGDFFYTNRIDFQAKINGFRIELSEIEYFANQKLQNAISIAVVSKDTGNNDILILFINDIMADESEILSHLEKHLPDYCIPTKIIKLENFPVNTSGKTDRIELKKMIL